MKYMEYIAITLNLILLHTSFVKSDGSQEKAHIVYANPKYIIDAKAFTARQGRSSTYVTNVTGTILQTWGNNVTLVLKYSLKTSADSFFLPVPLCDAINIAWMKYVLKYATDINIQCPYKPGYYAFYNVEIPPKNFPFPLKKGAYTLGLIFQTTATKEKILDISVVVHIK